MPKKQSMKTKHNPDLVHEFHYDDGDVGVYGWMMLILPRREHYLAFGMGFQKVKNINLPIS